MKSLRTGVSRRVLATVLSAALSVAFTPGVGVAATCDATAAYSGEASSDPVDYNVVPIGYSSPDGETDSPVQNPTAGENAEAVVVHGADQRFYDDAAVAAKALKDGETLQLLKDYQGQLTINACATIDLGGHKIINDSTDPAIDVFVDGSNRIDAGTVTIKNGTIESNGDAIAAKGTDTGLNIDFCGTHEGEELALQCPLGYSPVHLSGSARIECENESQAKEDVDNGFYVPASYEVDGGYVYGIEGGLSYAAKFAEDGGTIILLDNYEGPQKLVYSEGGGKFLALDLNDKTYYCTAAGNNQAALEFTAPGSYLLVEQGRIISDSAYAIYAGAGDCASANNLRLKLDCVSVIATNGIGLGMNENLTGAYILLENSQVTSDEQAGICFTAKGFMSISSTDISAKTIGVAVKRGTVNIFKNTGIYAISENVAPPSDYCLGDKAGIAASGYALYVEGGEAEGVTVNMDGGSLGGVGDAIKVFAKPEDAGRMKIAVTGGSFSSDVSAFMDKGGFAEYATHNGYFIVRAKDAAAPNNAAGYYWGAANENGVRSEVLIPSTPLAPVTPKPKPEPTPVTPGTNVSGTDGAGNTVEATVTDNNKTTLPDGTEAAGSVEFKGATASSGTGSPEPAKSVDVPATVTANGSTYVVTKIADEAFAGQSQLESVSIPETVVEIGSKAFAGTSITKAVIPAATSTIGAGVFQGCSALESVDIKSAALTNIPADAFNGTALSSIDIPSSVTSIGARAFKGTKLASVALPKAVATIEKGTFQNCSELASVASSAKVVAKSAFAGCGSLKTASLPKAAEVGAYAFSGTALRSISLPKAEAIGANAFKNAAKLKTLATGAKLEAIGPKALSGAKNLKVLTVTSKKLTKKGVHDSLKGSSVKRVEVAVSGGKSTLSEYVAKYGKFFKKSNSGKSVSVVPAKKKQK